MRDEDNARYTVLSLRVSKEEFATYEAAAKKVWHPRSKWIRLVLNKASVSSGERS